MDTIGKNLPTKGQVETILSQKRMLKLLQFKMELIEMHRGVLGEDQNLIDEYKALAKLIDQLIRAEAAREV